MKKNIIISIAVVVVIVGSILLKQYYLPPSYAYPDEWDQLEVGLKRAEVKKKLSLVKEANVSYFDHTVEKGFDSWVLESKDAFTTLEVVYQEDLSTKFIVISYTGKTDDRFDKVLKAIKKGN